MPLGPLVLAAVLAVTTAAALAQSVPPPPVLDLSAPLGSASNPVKAHMPVGQREYLRRLRCPDGEPPRFERVGSLGKGPHGGIIDGYKVECAGAEPKWIVMDMYHSGYRETVAVPGFSLAPEPAR